MRLAALVLLLLSSSVALAADPGPFTLSIQTPPYFMPVGSPVDVTGLLTANGWVSAGFPLESVVVRHDGVAEPATMTGADGSYRITVTAKARGLHLLRAYSDPVRSTYHVESPLASYRAVVPPGPPTALAIENIVDTYDARITWGAPADNGGAPVLGYKVYRDAGNGPVLIATTSDTVRTATDRMVPSSTWTYSVKARNVAGDGAPAALAFTAPPVPPADLFTASTPEYRRCWETPDCWRPWSQHIRTTTQPFRFWVPVKGTVANEGQAIADMPVTGSVSVTFPEGSTVTLTRTVNTRIDGTYEALVGPFEWGPGDGPQNVVHYFPVQAYSTYGTAYIDAGYHALTVWVGDPYGCGYCGGY